MLRQMREIIFEDYGSAQYLTGEYGGNNGIHPALRFLECISEYHNGVFSATLMFDFKPEYIDENDKIYADFPDWYITISHVFESNNRCLILSKNVNMYVIGNHNWYSITKNKDNNLNTNHIFIYNGMLLIAVNKSNMPGSDLYTNWNYVLNFMRIDIVEKKKHHNFNNYNHSSPYDKILYLN